MECTRCLMTDDIVKIHSDGECEFCKMHDELEGLKGFAAIADKVRTRKGYQCLIGISGGYDSSYLLWYTVKLLGIRPLVLHFDNRWNDPVAEYNMNLLVTKLGVDFLRITKDEYYDKVCGAMLKAGLKDADMANDMYMADIMQTVARKYNIKYIFNGHDFRYEGSTPLAWTYMDARYMKSVYKWTYGEELKTPHIQTFWKQIVAGIMGIKHIRVFHYFHVPHEDKMKTLLDFGIKEYDAKHGENIYTKWIGYRLLPIKWDIDKRMVYLSAQIRSGFITKEAAREMLKTEVEAKINDRELEKRTGMDIYEALTADRHTYKDFDYYHFKRFKPLIWLLWKFKLTSYHFYKKYAS